MATRPLNGDTVCLLKKCDSGSKMATDTIEQVMKNVKTDELRELLQKYNRDHIKLGEDIHALLREGGEEDQDPPGMAKAFAWIQTEMKMMMEGDEKQIASLLIDGCNMGTKSLSEYRNKYTEAEPKAVELCDRLYKLEKQMTNDLEQYL